MRGTALPLGASSVSSLSGTRRCPTQRAPGGITTRHRGCPGALSKVIGQGYYDYIYIYGNIAVTGAGDHVNSKDGRGSTYDYCSGDCLTTHVECSPVTTACSNSEDMIVCAYLCAVCVCRQYPAAVCGE